VFFDELLPEGAARQRLADRARVATTDTLGLLASHGRDVAGAVQVFDPSALDAGEPARARPVSTADIADLLDDVAAFPLGNVPWSGKASLAGVQDKVLLARVGGRWA
jgi:serine/threonine-protein kinase HipA